MKERKITIGITEMHGIAQEISQFPAAGVDYVAVEPLPRVFDGIISSTAKGVLRYFDGAGVDILEAPLFPILTNRKWLYTPADFQTCANFGILGAPLPRTMRVQFLKFLFRRPNFVKLLFKSQAGRKTLGEYGNLEERDLLDKVDVVYPAVRAVADAKIRFNSDRTKILFVGEFIRKGGIHVVDAFEELQKEFPNITLRICSAPDFVIGDRRLAAEYMDRIKANPAIEFGYVPRESLMETVLPETDIYVCPTYQETFGYSIEEAMAYGIPVIATNYFAIPELVSHDVSGFLIRTDNQDFIRGIKDYTVDGIPPGFHEYMSREVYRFLRLLVSDPERRQQMGRAGLRIARTKFSFETRNRIMGQIYRDAVGLGTVAP